MIEYKVGASTYALSYSELKEKYHEFCRMSNAQFLANLPAAAHFACVVGWFKEIGAEATIGDQGIVHELVHLMHIPETCGADLKRIRREFKTLLRLD